jgi:hypothetical protein
MRGCAPNREALGRTRRRSSPKPDSQAVAVQLDDWFNHYNEVHPKVLGCRSPPESRLRTGAVAGPRRPHGDNSTGDGLGSRPHAAPSTEAQSACLDTSRPPGRSAHYEPLPVRSFGGNYTAVHLLIRRGEAAC